MEGGRIFVRLRYVYHHQCIKQKRPKGELNTKHPQKQQEKVGEEEKGGERRE